MHTRNDSAVLIQKQYIDSRYLQRQVELDIYLPNQPDAPGSFHLLLINDGQNLEEMDFAAVLEYLQAEQVIQPLVCVGIHAGNKRIMEYGVASQADYAGRGAEAGLYTAFVLAELLPFIHTHYPGIRVNDTGIAGFSLGGLMALDIAWNHPQQFTIAGMFSGSFWWRSLDQADKAYDDDQHRIMQQEIRRGAYKPGLRFFFQCGNRDETMDRNNNGIIDSIDDTQAVIVELKEKGYQPENINYFEMPEGRHDTATWAEAMPVFLKWAWGRK